MDKLDILRASVSRSREALKVWGLVAVVLLLGFAAALPFVEPAPPRSIVLATGDPGGAYERYGEELAAELAKVGLRAELRSTAGSVENVRLLLSGEADVAFVQGGVVPAEAREELVGVASLYFEPLWIFHRRELEIESLADLSSRRIAIGEAGSGTQRVARAILEANGISAAQQSSPKLLELGPEEAVTALLEERIDALFLVVSPDSSLVRRLIESPGVRLFDVRRHLAYERAFPFLSHVVLPEGVLDFGRDVPSQDVNLISPAATLLARRELHPALLPLLIQAAEERHGRGTVLSAPGRFPSPQGLDVPLAASARTYFEHGRSLLYRILPFRLAAMIDRLKIMALPLLTLLLPLIRFVPPIYRWRIRSQIYRWYQALDRLESRLDQDPATLAECIADIDRVEEEIRDRVNVPASYMEELYNLRMHMERLREHLQQRLEGPSSA